MGYSVFIKMCDSYCVYTHKNEQKCKKMKIGAKCPHYCRIMIRYYAGIFLTSFCTYGLSHAPIRIE